MFLARSLLAFSVIVAVTQGINSTEQNSTATSELCNDEKPVNCDHYRLFYEELQCKPESFDNVGCASSYNCPPYKTGSNFCRYRGVEYAIEEEVPDSLVPECRFNCQCIESYLVPGKTMFSYAQPRCIGNKDPDNCYMGYTTENTCCPFKELCPPFEDDSCKVENNVYQINQKHEPADTCSVCVCTKNEKGVAVLECHKKVCGVELNDSEKIEQNCAPLYSSDTYCPDEMVCKEGIEIIDISLPKSSQNGSCNFNDSTYPTGTTFTANKSGSAIKCSCSIPPFLTCTY